MFGNIKTKGILINMEYKQFANKDTGVVTCMTLVRYAVPGQLNNEFKGSVILECYTSEEAFTKLEKFLTQECAIEISQKPTVNGTKYILLSVNDINLKKNK